MTITDCQKGSENISFLPAIVSTFIRMHGEILRLLFLQPEAHRENEDDVSAISVPLHKTTRTSSDIQSVFFIFCFTITS